MSDVTPGPLRRWVLAARTRTLPAAIVPVAIGAAAVRPATVNWLNTGFCVLIALALQIGTNYANDYSDGIKGTDEVRVGPFRLTASKLVSASAVKRAAFVAFGLAAVLGLVLAARSSWWMVLIGASAIAAGWFYTGGPKPYGYYGFGELFVMVYFGFVATVGTSFVQGHYIPTRAWWLALAAGGAACALLEANNLRDVAGDRQSGKKTLAARLGRERGSWLMVVCVAAILVGSVVGGHWIAGVVALVLYALPLRMTFSPRQGRELLPLLAAAARSQLLLGVVLVVTCVIVHP